MTSEKLQSLTVHAYAAEQARGAWHLLLLLHLDCKFQMRFAFNQRLPKQLIMQTCKQPSAGRADLSDA